MIVKDPEEFIIDCNKGFCNRHTIYNKKTCKTKSKQMKCYEKYITNLEKNQNRFIKKMQENSVKLQEAIDTDFVDEIDLKWEETKKQVWKRDTRFEFPDTYRVKNWMAYCAIWNSILSADERLHIIGNFTPEINDCYSLSNMHIESRQRNPELKYDINNIILAGDYFHSLFDNFQDLITRESMDNDRRNYWIDRFNKYVRNINAKKI